MWTEPRRHQPGLRIQRRPDGRPFSLLLLLRLPHESMFVAAAGPRKERCVDGKVSLVASAAVPAPTLVAVQILVDLEAEATPLAEPTLAVGAVLRTGARPAPAASSALLVLIGCCCTTFTVLLLLRLFNVNHFHPLFNFNFFHLLRHEEGA